MKLQSMVMVTGDPEWAIRIEDNYLYYKNENYIITNGDEPVEDLSEDDNEEITFSEETTKRWGSSFEDPLLGNCTNCKFYIRLNASYNFLDYGVCSNKSSNFDKKIVNVKSGCPNFKKEI
ncbi:DUF3027 domain-containing protein [Leptospira ognonensis]|uniref:DUF3027 domain-containing protein n=1 Tax=Leptospira ognonensis TaxID=2484945 RepID=A0A4R9K1L5_9LEPT|nr:DUF3027 domain-containing protein [Leptospira ognonensis]TGL59006.1 DUF3027 domain-containing protein [Leptospira ognonensis]